MSRVVSIAADGAERARAELDGAIAAGEIVVFPSDGLYGLACDPLRADAIARIDQIKGRDEGKPAAVLYLSPLAMRELLASLGPRTRDALSALLPGPLTLVVRNPERRYPLACREDPERLGVRLIEGPLAGAMCPLLQTSANRAGARPPARFAEIERPILERVDLAIDGGELSGMPSTVLDITAIEEGGEPVLLRAGAVAEDAARERLANALDARK